MYPDATVFLHQGDSPLILAQPHTGTWLPESVVSGLSLEALALKDTDWHIDKLYADLLPDATVVRARFHRYLIDPNRDPAGQSLYPGQNSTELCPTTDFDGVPLYRPGRAPTAAQIEQERLPYHRAYHQALTREIERVKARWGLAIVFDCHSIRSEISHLFDGVLPVFNLGTHDGASCDPALEALALACCEQAAQSHPDFNTVLNGRFKGGWTTRHYGQPPAGVHAIQLELAQRAYLLEAPPWTYNSRKALLARQTLQQLLQRLSQWAKAQGSQASESRAASAQGEPA